VYSRPYRTTPLCCLQWTLENHSIALYTADLTEPIHCTVYRIGWGTCSTGGGIKCVGRNLSINLKTEGCLWNSGVDGMPGTHGDLLWIRQGNLGSYKVENSLNTRVSSSERKIRSIQLVYMASYLRTFEIWSYQRERRSRGTWDSVNVYPGGRISSLGMGKSFLLSTSSRPVLGSNQLPSQWLPRAPSLG
jgi:hypothetical protein